MNTRKDLKRKKHTFEDRLKYMHMIEDGHSIHSIHCKYGIKRMSFMFFGANTNHLIARHYVVQEISRRIQNSSVKYCLTLKKIT